MRHGLSTKLKLRNEITSDIRKAKACYLQEKLNQVKTTGSFWKLLAKVTNPKVRKSIGPLKRDDDSLTVDVEENDNLMNTFFATVGENLAKNLPTLPQPTNYQDVPAVSTISSICLSNKEIEKKVASLKLTKSTGPDGISPKLLKMTGSAVVPPLTDLYTLSANTTSVFGDWKKARLNPVFKKYDKTERSYRPLSMLSVPSKTMESCVADTIVQHAFTDNDLVIDKRVSLSVYHHSGL